MPGHVTKSLGPDPDPSEFLYVSQEMKLKDMAKPYDSKKDCWIPDEKEGFKIAQIQQTDGEMVEVLCKGVTTKWKKDQIGQVNPPKYEKTEDVSYLTYLNDASVLYNLKTRYQARLIYTYSGLFCIAVNPYKRFPIYTARAAAIYTGKRRNEVPPHIFAISDGAYQNMMMLNENQSMLITGESGAGKTENTKKVITYFGFVGSTTQKLKKGEKPKQSLEDQIVATNPVLEAFGNAKTTRNDNSSRFGKFIRIHFQPNGKLAGADIENYLLEKARVISQSKMERGYHIFYNIMTGWVPGLKDMCFLSDNIYDYHFVSQGKVTVASIDDREDMEFAHQGFTTLLFTDEERDNIYRLVAIVMHLGEMKFKQRGREEQAEPDGTDTAEKVSQLLGVEMEALLTAFCKPKIKVGAEFVVKGQNVEKVMDSIGALAKSFFDRLFKFIVKKANVTLETGLRRAHFIGVLDIAGFEIFEFNGFEQICINFCNEKLQQFFNHHMFVLEQEEYKREGIDWVFVDFGMDLQACIELFEKPMGLLSILEEESMFPKATDKSFSEKLNTNCLGKSPAFIKPKGEAHFGICHYAGVVNYNITGWLEKNKDPLNDTVVDLLKKGTNNLIVDLFADHPGQSAPAEEKGGKGGKGGKKKSGGFKTVSSGYREQLNSLMTTLNATNPHFIRCIVPNENKQPGGVDAALIMHQLTCNGVLEGIRICRKGFPNRMSYPDFKQRYKILGSADFVANPTDDMAAVKACFKRCKLEEEKFRVGYTKVFFRAGVLGEIEELRDIKLGQMVTGLQSWVRGFFGRRRYVKLQEQRAALVIVQRNIKKFLFLRNWPWYNLWQRVKPIINQPRIEDEIRELEERSTKAVEECQKAEDLNAQLNQQHDNLIQEKEELILEVDANKGNITEYVERQQQLNAQINELEQHVNETSAVLEDEQASKATLTQSKRKVELEVNSLKRDFEELEMAVQKVNQEKETKDHQIRNLNDEIAHQEEILNKVNKEKKMLQEGNQKVVDDFGGVEDKANHLNKVKAKLEQTLDELADSLDREKKLRSEVEKAKRKVEGDVRLTQECVSDLERTKKEIESQIIRKESECSGLSQKIEEEQINASKVMKRIKELQAHIEELEDELRHESQARAKTEKSKQKLQSEIDEITDRLDEAGGATLAQIELNKKREAELAKIRRDIEESNIHHEAAVAGLRKKHNDAVAEMSEQLDHLGKMKIRVEKDKEGMKRDTDDAKAAMDGLSRDKAAAEKVIKQLQQHTLDVQSKLDEANRSLNDFDAMKKRLAVENGDLLRQLEEAEIQVGQLTKLKMSLSNQLDELQKIADDENKARQVLLGKFRNLEHDHDGLREQLEEEHETKSDLQRQLSKALAEAQMYRAKYESEGIARAEELEAARLKLSARLEEAEQQIEQLTMKNINLEKLKERQTAELEGMTAETERAQISASNAEKKQKMFEKVVGEWKLKVDDLTADVDNSQKECRNFSTELFRMKACYEESLEHLDQVRRENKNLSDEIKDLMDQIGEGGRSMHEVAKNAKRLEIEKEELQAALEEAEAALEQEENKVLRGQLELSQVRQEIDKRIHEKEEEFDSIRKTHQKALDSMQSNLEQEAKGKAEAIRMKKKLESDINELEISLEHSSRANADIQKQIKKLQLEMKDMQDHFEEEQRLASEYREQFGIAERRANALQGELDEARSLLEQSDRARRQAEAELSDVAEQLQTLGNQNSSLQVSKRKLEGEMQTMNCDLDDMLKEARHSEEKAKKAMVDAARLADELRAEQEHAQLEEKTKKSLEANVKDLKIRIEESETTVLKAGKRALTKLEGRVRELEGQFDDEVRRHADAQKSLRKCERRIKELTFQSEEDKKNHERMQEHVDKLQQKIKTYKHQIEEAEEIAALNLSKFRKAQQELETIEGGMA